MKIKLIACEVMRDEILSISSVHNIDVHFINMGFHLKPEKLHTELNSILSKASGVDRIILGFGLCGGAARNLKAPDCVLTIPRAHDCIPILLGSSEIFRQQQMEKGTFYLSCGWFKGEKNILSEYERIVDKYGQARAQKIIARIYSSYRRILFIHTGHPDERSCYEKSLESAKLLGLDFHTIKGRRDYITKIVNGPWDQADFINVEPGGSILEEEFFSQCNKEYVQVTS